jgi:hypothetical protein
MTKMLLGNIGQQPAKMGKFVEVSAQDWHPQPIANLPPAAHHVSASLLTGNGICGHPK